jgi:anion-transporting  ArsA/GET3 family ATPase
MSPPEPGGLRGVVAAADVVVCCGSGGVGKTSCAAALAIAAAEAGRRVAVVTIDPARRLADALGLAALGNDPHEVAGDWPGALWALMLDTKATFDDVVRTHAPSPEQAERILTNRFYRNISGALSGTQEYMAAEKLAALSADPRFDLVVVDTPPTRNALDFLDAPARLTRFLDHRLFRLVVLPGRTGLRVAGAAAQAFVKTVGKVVGASVLEDAVAFFAAFEGMEAGFRNRAAAVAELLVAPSTAYVLVASPRAETVEEAIYFAHHLRSHAKPAAAVVVNRQHPRFVAADRLAGVGGLAARERAATLAGTDLGRQYANLADWQLVAEAEERELAPLFAVAGDAALARVPLFDDDVHDLAGLRRLGAHLLDGLPG